MIRLSELLGRIDGKLDGALSDLSRQREEIGSLGKRVGMLEQFKSRIIGWAVGSALAGSAAGSALVKALLS